MANGLLLIDGDGYGRQTQSADTVIAFLTGARQSCYTHLLFFRYTSGGTAHTAKAVRGASRTTLSASAAAAQLVINITAALTDGDGNAMAASDYLGIKKPDGTWHLALVTSISSLAVTLTANVPTGGFARGAPVVCYGAAADTANAVYAYYPTTSTVTNFPAVDMLGSLVRAPYKGEPLLLHSTNATAQGYFDATSWGFSKG